jgi:hypothetical protein
MSGTAASRGARAASSARRGRVSRRPAAGSRLRAPGPTDRRGSGARELGVAGADFERAPERVAARLGALARVDVERRARHDRALEQTPRARHREQARDCGRARAVPEHGDLAGVAAERVDLVAHPLEPGAQVEQPEVRREEAERPEPVRERHDDQVAAAREPAPAHAGFAGRALGEAAAVHEDEYRARHAVEARRPEVEREAVLALLRRALARQRREARGVLRRRRRRLAALAHPGHGSAAAGARSRSAPIGGARTARRGTR